MADLDIPELIKSYIALITMAVVPIWIGCHGAIQQQGREKMSKNDALLFPIFGSAALFSLYIAFKYFSREMVNKILQYYFLLFGAISVGDTLSPVFDHLLPYSLVKRKKPLIRIKFWLPDIIVEGGVDLKIFPSNLVGYMIGLAVAVAYISTKHWIINNILGLSFCITGIRFMSLETFTTGAFLLCGLFLYDIFWVFGTDVMVTVATNFNAPIKLVWPRGDRYSILGLGDIVIPGFFISLMLHFDIARAIRAFKSSENSKDNKKVKLSNLTIRKTYFMTCFVAYVLGLIATVAVLTIFKHGQPALLYLVPACLGSVVLLAMVRGELKSLLGFDASKEVVFEK